MIRPPLAECRDRKLETVAVSVAAAMALFVPLGLLVGAMCAERSAEAWLAAYDPVVYLTPGATPEVAAEIADEVGGWTGVATARVRTPGEAHAFLTARMGEPAVSELGVSAAAMPTSIVVEPSLPVAGHLDLVSRVTALEAREEVEAVVVPSSAAMHVIELSTAAMASALLLVFLALFAGGALFLNYLRRLREGDGTVDRLALVFGAYPEQVRRPTLVRGGAVGLWTGAACAIALMMMLIFWHFYSSGLLGIDDTIPVLAWPIAGAPLLVGPVWGFVAGWFAAASSDEVHYAQALRG